MNERSKEKKDSRRGQPVDEETKDEKWVITDNMSMKNYHQLVQDPAIEYPFELDDF